MPYILNTFVPENKKCLIALNEIFGLGKNLIVQICDQLGFSAQIKCKDLSANQLDRLARCISQNYLIGVDLRGIITQNRDGYISISSFRGFRYIDKLPCRGQRTHGNAQTSRRQPWNLKKSSDRFASSTLLTKRR